ncbi:MAG: sulfur transferase domain-containing protein [Phenylobacterium sp.]|uniref:fused DSP-PTPase phosphatase/NAD kinase-like protein n=1 Tax=Phenylobacterium sp. TaxID=1871053 RepID=UPI002A35BF95|nr:sulfur transferase domain-containing protein [Phenylobacterium sp.]
MLQPDRPENRFDLSTPGGRVRTYLDYLWNDHAYLRLGFSNAHWISEELVRTNQPWPHQLAAWKRRGIKTVVNLRGGFDASFHALEKDACAKHGLTMVDFTITSRETPSRERVLGAKRLFETVEYPALMHCKSGADRAGIMSVFYMHFRKGKTIREAMDQLHLRYLHVRHGKTGVLDYTFERYLAEGEPAGMSFLEWVESPMYDPAGIKADFRAQWWGTLMTERFLKRE